MKKAKKREKPRNQWCFREGLGIYGNENYFLSVYYCLTCFTPSLFQMEKQSLKEMKQLFQQKATSK